MSKKLSRAERKERPMLEAIRRRYNQEYPVDLRSVPLQTERWNKVCDLTIAEFEEEGLHATSSLVKQFKK